MQCVMHGRLATDDEIDWSLTDTAVLKDLQVI